MKKGFRLRKTVTNVSTLLKYEIADTARRTWKEVEGIPDSDDDGCNENVEGVFYATVQNHTQDPTLCDCMFV